MANPRWGLLRRSCLKSPEEDQHLKMTRQENLRTASTRFGQSTEVVLPLGNQCRNPGRRCQLTGGGLIVHKRPWMSMGEASGGVGGAGNLP